MLHESGVARELDRDNKNPLKLHRRVFHRSTSRTQHSQHTSPVPTDRTTTTDGTRAKDHVGRHQRSSTQANFTFEASSKSAIPPGAHELPVLAGDVRVHSRIWWGLGGSLHPASRSTALAAARPARFCSLAVLHLRGRPQELHPIHPPAVGHHRRNEQAHETSNRDTQACKPPRNQRNPSQGNRMSPRLPPLTKGKRLRKDISTTIQ